MIVSIKFLSYIIVYKEIIVKLLYSSVILWPPQP